jgi:hypothetical protein
MRAKLFPIFLVAAFAAAPVSASTISIPGIFSSVDRLEFVAETEITNNAGGQLSVCQVVHQTTVVGLPLWRSLRGFYGLAEDRCQSNRFLVAEPDQIAAAKAAGLIPADLPDQPRNRPNRVIAGFWGWSVLSMLAAVALGLRRRRRAVMSDRLREIGAVSPLAQAVVDAMCHFAKADGRLDEDDLEAIAAISLPLTGERFEADRIRRIYDLADADLPAKGFDQFATGLDATERRQVLRAVLTLVGPDEDPSATEQRFIDALAAALDIPGPDVARLAAFPASGALTPA